MKIMFLFISLIIGMGSVCAQGIDFKELTYKEALKMAKEQNKIVFIDVYTSWCGPCKALATKIFPQKEVGDFFNEHFIAIKKDAEKSEDGRNIKKDFAVTVYPTLLFVNGDGELVYRFSGGKDVKGLLQEGKNALTAYKNYPLLKSCEEKYAKGNRDTAFLNTYVHLLESVGKDISIPMLELAAKVSDEVLRSRYAEEIGKIKVYDSLFLNRLATIAYQMKASGTVDKKVSAAYHAGICKYMSGAMGAIVRGGTEAEFNKLLAKKEEIFSKVGLRDNLYGAAMGQGNIFIPTAFLYVDYYEKKGMQEKFVSLFDEVMAMLLKVYKKDLDRRLVVLEHFRKDGTRCVDSNMVKQNPFVYMMQKSNMLITASMLVNSVETYEKWFKGEKDEKYTDKISQWYVLFHLLSPTLKSTTYIADKLLEKNRKDMAMDVVDYERHELLSKKDGKEKEEETKALDEYVRGLK